FEIAIKQTLGKLPKFTFSITSLIKAVQQDGFNILNIQTQHIDRYQQIPLLPNHRDPFDRLLLATALSENMTIISSDANFKLYVPQIQLITND
ncbi:MAG: twitching motility protein PilT, partial [Hyphomonadaceae bacterium]